MRAKGEYLTSVPVPFCACQLYIEAPDSASLKTKLPSCDRNSLPEAASSKAQSLAPSWSRSGWVPMRGDDSDFKVRPLRYPP